MKNRKWTIFIVIILLVAVFIRWYTTNKFRVESEYSQLFYPNVGVFFRTITGWFSISIGDILYGIAACWLLFSFVKLMIGLFTRNFSREKVWNGAKKTFLTAGIIYIIFNIFWGINYNRLGIAHQLNLDIKSYTVEDLKEINEVLVNKVNTAKQALAGKPYPSTSQLFAKVKEAYNEVGATYPFLNYPAVSIKSSLWGWLGNYTGFTGYYNPFTGESQVNTSIPKFLQPYTACHEVAHQIGYAKEMEANFVGYLAASSSKDTLFHYSVYLDLFLYSNSSLRSADSAAAKSYRNQLIPAVQADLKEWSVFNKRHKNPIEPIIRWAYSQYLQNNQQPQGMMAYNEVTSFIIAYYKKFGKI